ncbi:hypothetical protein Pst134EA_030346 [Puccinia striiformis f. sp. tritici]|uniref:hypothetical protein n=1 Tax=Puccinia striiformis f. sp. tritici TaxID=168172 RepID=UPI002007E540|nr:hypothetical protein Pst134EA_030346 [Puccinia striiformis f. sp. tritici]KAH9446429.1 hypothetical protein Pst134EA_030346 [Puccinia striiformis f. sp. tritici]
MKRDPEELGTGPGVVDQLTEVANKLPKTSAHKDGADQQSTFISPTSERPDRQTQLFDRQLRLWKSLGQQQIEEAAVKICDCSATSAQIAKNLVLAGVKMIDTFDDKIVRQSDIGHHFFLNQSSLGKNRSKEFSRLLNELPGKSYADYNEELLDANYFEGFDDLHGFWGWQAHICVRLVEDHEEVTSRYCWDFYVPTIMVQTCGLVASIRLQIRELGVIPTESDSSADLRLDCPFPTLSEFVNSFEMEKMDDHEHAHIPAVVIIIHFLEIFKSQHDGCLPKDSTQRDELKEMILAEKRNSDEENFDEAVGMIWKACQPTKVPEHIEELFKDPHCDKMPWHDRGFWLLVSSLREFVNENPNHQLPLSGSLPDMKSDTKNYTKLQSIYREQALEDLETFKECLETVEETIGEHSRTEEENQTDVGHYAEGPEHDLSEEMVESFVKNSAHIRLVRGSESFERPKGLSLQFAKECEAGNEDYTVTWYLAFEALSDYRSKNKGEYPGMREGQEEEDFDTLSEIVFDYLKGLGWDQSDTSLPEKLEKALKEMIRSAGSELPQISSLVGGMVSQEVLKLITGQFIPINGICIIDGYRSTTGILEL